MKRDMKRWLEELRGAPVKKAMPVLSFPAIQLMGISVRELISSSDAQARGMHLVAQRTDAAASVSLMDLSVEAECFGSAIRVSDEEVPTVVGSIVSTEEEARALAVPPVGAGRTGLYIEAVEKAVGLITDRPVFAGVIGPFSLAARLLDVAEIMIYCYEEPDMVHVLLEKATQFITEYCKAYKEAGANGVVIAEPVAGLLSPALSAEFSGPYVKQIVDAVQDDSFLVIYGNTAQFTSGISLNSNSREKHGSPCSLIRESIRLQAVRQGLSARSRSANANIILHFAHCFSSPRYRVLQKRSCFLTTPNTCSTFARTEDFACSAFFASYWPLLLSFLI